MSNDGYPTMSAKPLWWTCRGCGADYDPDTIKQTFRTVNGVTHLVCAVCRREGDFVDGPDVRSIEVAKYRKKPVVIDAVRWAGNNWDAVYALGEAQIQPGEAHSGTEAMPIDIITLEGTMRADVGDWIIKGVQGELYPCKPDIFEATYESVDA